MESGGRGEWDVDRIGGWADGGAGRGRALFDGRMGGALVARAGSDRDAHYQSFGRLRSWYRDNGASDARASYRRGS